MGDYTKFDASISMNETGEITLVADRLLPENKSLFVTCSVTISGKEFWLDYLHDFEQIDDYTYRTYGNGKYLAAFAGRQVSVLATVYDTDTGWEYEAKTKLNISPDIAPEEPLVEITQINYDPVTQTISGMLSNGEPLDNGELLLSFSDNFGAASQGTYYKDSISGYINMSINWCNLYEKKYNGSSFWFRAYNGEAYGLGQAIYIYPDGSWKNLGTGVSVPAGKEEDTTPPELVTGLAAQVKQYSVTVEWNKSSIRNCTYELLVDGWGSVVTKSNKFTFKNVPVGRYSGSVRVIAPDGTAGEWSEPYTIAVADVTAPKLGKVSAVVDGYTGVISWSGSDNVGVEYYEVRCADQVQVVSGTSARFENLAVGKYNAEVTAFDAAGNASKAGKASIAVKDATPPEKVTGLVEPEVDAKYKAVLSWDPGVDNSGKVANYEIQLDDGKILKSSKTTLNVSNLSVGEHSYKVRAIDKDKNVGEWSEVQTFTVKDMTAPTSVKGKATVDGYIVTFALSGKDNSGSIAKYVVTCGDQSVETTTETAVLSDFGVGKQTAYVVAYDAEGNASKETKVSFTVKDATPPEKVTGLVEPEVDAKYKAVLSWDPGVDNSGKVANYEIQLDDGKILKSSKTTLNVSNLSVGEHSYKVRAIDKDKNVGEWSEVQTFTVKDMTAPGSVSAKAKVEGNSLFLSWKTPKDNVGVTGYLLQYGEELENSAYLAADVLEYRIDGIARGSYQYRLTAFDAAGNESKPKIGKATIKTDLPVAELNGESPVAMELCCFEPATSALPADDPLAFCNTLRLDAELSLSASELVGSLENERRSESLFATAS